MNELKAAVSHLIPEQAVSLNDLNPADPKGIQRIQYLAQALRNKLGIDKAVVTLGEYGMLASEGDKFIHRPTMAKAVSDVSGAGDTSLAILGAALSSGTMLENALDLANIGAGVVVGKEGTATLSQKELRNTLSDLFNTDSHNYFRDPQVFQNTL